MCELRTMWLLCRFHAVTPIKSSRGSSTCEGMHLGLDSLWSCEIGALKYFRF